MESFKQILAGTDIVIGTAVSNWTNEFEGFPKDHPDQKTPDKAGFWKIRHFVEPHRRAAFETTLRENFSSLVAENGMKMDQTWHLRNENKWKQDAQQLIDFAGPNNLNLKGHTLVWHNQLPPELKNWTGSKEAKRVAIRDHVGFVAASMKGAGCNCIDVLNECIDDENHNGHPRTLREFWTDGLGFKSYEEAVPFIAELFRAARGTVGPDVTLCINDYSTTTVNEKSDALFKLCEDIKALPEPFEIDEVGFQAHHEFGEIDDGFVDSMKLNFARFKRIGMTSNISELDLGFGKEANRNNEPPDDAAAQVEAARAAPAWYKFFKAALADLSMCNHITLWGFDTRVSWRFGDPKYERADQNACCPWRTDSGGVLRETPIVDAIRRALKEIVRVTWQPFGCDVSTGFLTQNRSGGTFSGPQYRLSPNTDYTLRTRIAGVAANDVFLTLKFGDNDGDFVDFVRLWDKKTANVNVAFRTSGKAYNIIYLEGPPVEKDFVVGPTFLNGQAIKWDSNFPANGSIREVTYASDRQGAFAGLSVAPTGGRMWTLSTRVYSGKPLKLTLQFWDFDKRGFGFKTLGYADAAGKISESFHVPERAPDGTPARAYIESESEHDSVQDYAAEAPTLWTILSPM